VASKFSRDIARLGGWLKQSASDPITYVQGDEAVDLLSVYGPKLLRITDADGGVRTERTDMSFVVLASDFHFGDGITIEPRRGDLVYLTIGDEVHKFMVLPFGTEPCWHWCEPYHRNLRFHTKRVNVESAYGYARLPRPDRR
jgi:hypothetical protein